MSSKFLWLSNVQLLTRLFPCFQNNLHIVNSISLCRCIKIGSNSTNPKLNAWSLYVVHPKGRKKKKRNLSIFHALQLFLPQLFNPKPRNSSWDLPSLLPIKQIFITKSYKFSPQFLSYPTTSHCLSWSDPKPSTILTVLASPVHCGFPVLFKKCLNPVCLSNLAGHCTSLALHAPTAQTGSYLLKLTMLLPTLWTPYLMLLLSEMFSTNPPSLVIHI